ncbi:MAG: hypothetical protein ACSHYF_06350 [Verrucomicrobiaceae bacterium]
MVLKKSHELWAILVGSAFLLYRVVAPFMGGLNRWQDVTPVAVLFLAIPVVTAAAPLLLGWKYDRRIVGLSGFLGSAIFLPIIPAFIAVLIILYAVTTKPLVLTAVWTGLASLIAAIPFIYYRLIGSPDLLYAGGAGLLLFVSLVVSAIFLLISIAVWLCHLVKRARS